MGGNTLAIMHNLAGVYANQGKLDEAIAMHEQVLAAKRTLYGTDEHPSVLHSLDGYARALAGKKRYDEAVAMQQQALALRLRFRRQRERRCGGELHRPGLGAAGCRPLR